MNSRELKAERVKKGYSTSDMTRILGLKHTDTYRKKENGVSTFTNDEIITISNTLEFNGKMINLIFYDNRLPI